MILGDDPAWPHFLWENSTISRTCSWILSAFLLLYLAALCLLVVGTFGLFGNERDPLGRRVPDTVGAAVEPADRPLSGSAVFVASGRGSPVEPAGDLADRPGDPCGSVTGNQVLIARAPRRAAVCGLTAARRDDKLTRSNRRCSSSR